MRAFIITTAVCALFGVVCAMDYDDATTEQAYYCQMVESGMWPEHREGADCE